MSGMIIIMSGHFLQVDLSEESLLKQFEIVKRETNTSHVQKYGDMVSKLNNIWDFHFCTTDSIYTVITSSKPLVSHCDGMKRYSCRIGNSESNCWWKTGWLNRCLNCVHIDVQSPIIEGVYGSSLLLINKNIQCTLKGDSHFFFEKSLEVLFQVHVPPQKSSVHSVLKYCLSLWWDFLSSQ